VSELYYMIWKRLRAALFRAKAFNDGKAFMHEKHNVLYMMLNPSFTREIQKKNSIKKQEKLEPEYRVE
jgi:hypothetical protein